jgi:hypothetical protein
MPDFADQVRNLPPELQKQLKQKLRELGCADAFTEPERRYANEVAFTLDPASGDEAAGRHVNRAAVKPLVEATLAHHTAVSQLKAEYVREYIMGVLELCPTDYFEFDADGDWVTSIEKLSRAPVEVRRLVESVEFKTRKNHEGKPEKTLKVTFLSKSSALSLAARYTLVQRIEAAVTTVPWDEIAGARARQGSVEDDVQSRLAGTVPAALAEHRPDGGAGARDRREDS